MSTPVVIQRPVRAAAVCRQGCQHPCRGAEADPHGSVCSEDHSDSPLQCVGKVVNVLVVQVVKVPQMPVVDGTDGPHSCCDPSQFLDKVVASVGVVTVQKTAEVPHVQFLDKVVAVPVDNLLIGGYGGDAVFFWPFFMPFFALRPFGR